MIYVTRNIWIDEKEIKEEFVRASGPGGQNVNKVATAVQLRFDVRHSPSLPGDVRRRLLQLAANRISADGVLVIDARRFRHRELNRQDAQERLKDWIRKASIKNKLRIKTKPSRSSGERRLESKRQKSKKKRLRQPIRNLTD